MRVNDVKQILWWLSGGLVICIGVLVAVMFFLKPSRPYAARYAKYGGQQMSLAVRTDRDRHTANRDFRTTYGATYTLKIDGIEPPRPVEPVKPVEAKAEKRDFKLAEFINVTALWLNGAFYRLKRDESKLEEVKVGECIPTRKIPELAGKAMLVRIEFEDSPFRAVFDVNGKEEVFLVARHEVMLPPRQASVAFAEEYRGPAGGVAPLERTVAPSGVQEKNGEILIGRNVREMIKSDYNGFLKDVAWDAAPKGGIAVVKIRKGSRFDMLNAQAGGLVREGDVIVSVNGVKVQSKAQIINHFKKNPVPPGSKLNVVINRYGRKVNKVITVPRG